MIDPRYCSHELNISSWHIILAIGDVELRISMFTQVEVLAKKYEEKYRQTGNVASKLTIEEATFHDIQVYHVIQ